MTVSARSRELQAVVSLADQNTGTLGFIPEEALHRGAARQRVFVAADNDGRVVGYVWYSVTPTRALARLHHLCVTDDSRNCGVGRALVNELKRRTSTLSGIALRCRRSNSACDFYRRVGFVPIDEQRGRGREPEVLTCFLYDHGHPDLSTEHFRRLAQCKAMAVIDANVFFDLQDPQSQTYRQSQALRADWIGEWAALCVTDELYNEIDRNPDSGARKRNRALARSLPQIRINQSTFGRFLELVEDLLPEPRRRSDESDRRHLAAAIAANAEYFITHDRGLLDLAPRIAEAFGVGICSPLEFVLDLDEAQRKADYHPARLAGSGLTMQRVSASDVPTLQSSFLNHAAGETRGEFDSRLHNALAECSNARGHVVRSNATDLALLVVSDKHAVTSEVCLLRICQHRLAPTLARHMVARVVTDAVHARRSLTLITDPNCPNTVMEAATELGFTRTGNGLAKVCISGLHSVESALDALARIRQQASDVATAFDSAREMLGCINNARSASEDQIDRLERVLWPLKVIDFAVPSFMVPIQPKWAKHLFDTRLAAQDLFAVDTFLALQCENVYYRSSNPPAVTAPSRVLWYISSDKQYSGTGQIKACSRVQEVAVGPASKLFKQFSRLGVYGWEDVLTVARGDPHAEIAAFRFSNTESLPRPIPMNRVRCILSDERNTTPQFTTALRLSHTEFARLYRYGCGDCRD